ncbi:hypothetical protein CCR75_005854 [Bremia lactucae]|uniref:PDZ domain-containing protein n=1 Tax=Bremia lactucae TaxID=4779 RepID=A0A976IC13_BRELC|nr:hypothetical protein CCR75_005854 [Bremia lactucae]
MGESLTVRLFVRTQTYDIPCDPRQPARWLLYQAKNIERANHKTASDEFEVLFNRTTRRVVDLEASIGSSISAMDVVDARTLLPTFETSYNSALFPWVRSYPETLLSSETQNSANGLFFQQLYAFTLIGKRTPVITASHRKQKDDQEAFLSLLQKYVLGSYDPNLYGHLKSVRRAIIPSSPAYTPPCGTNTFSDSGSDSSGDLLPPSTPHFVSKTHSMLVPTPASPVHKILLKSSNKTLNRLDNVFDIVFKQQAIGMKLGADESKQLAIVKECFDGSEAKRYPEIQCGVIILAVNGQEVTGLGLSRVLYRLREAPRPVVVRFGRMSPRELLEQRKARGKY